MAQLRQGAPGVRIRLRDVSEVTLVTNPNIVGGIVGFSTRGELNKIIKLNSTSDMDVYLGNGYNNPKFNQGLYAARSVLTSGGFVEYVRPYGEVVIEDDSDPAYAYNQQLKTDTYLIAYNYADGVTESFDNQFWTSTRYVQDAYANYGTRYINTISETLVQNTNNVFELNADSLPDGQGGFDKTALFSIMNTDPTAANRAGSKFDISSITSSSLADASIEITSIQGTSSAIPYHIAVSTYPNAHGLNTGDLVTISATTDYNVTDASVVVESATTFYFESDLIDSMVLETSGTLTYPRTQITVITKNNNTVSVDNTVVIGGTVNYNNPSALVNATNSLREFTYLLNSSVSYVPEYVGAVFLNLDTIASGVDYLAIKTAARGRATKYFDGFYMGGDGSISNLPDDGNSFEFLKPDGSVAKFEFDSNGSFNSNNGYTRIPIQTNTILSSGASFSINAIQGDGSGLIQVGTSAFNGFATGDVVSISGTTDYDTLSATITVLSPTTFEFTDTSITSSTLESTGVVATVTLPAGGFVLQDVTNLQVNDLVEFYNPTLTITSIQGNGSGPNHVTVVTSQPHNLQVNDEITIAGTTNYDESSAVVVDTIVSSTSFKYYTTSNSSAALNSSGSVTVLSFPNGGITASPTQYVVSSIVGNNIFVNEVGTWTLFEVKMANLSGILGNLTGTVRNVQNAIKNAGYAYTPTRAYFNTATGVQTDNSLKVSDASKFNVNDIVMVFSTFDCNIGPYNLADSGFESGIDGVAYVVTSINLSLNTITLLKATLSATGSVTSTTAITFNNNNAVDVNLWITNITKTKGAASWMCDEVLLDGSVYKPSAILSAYLGLKVPIDTQDSSTLQFLTVDNTPVLTEFFDPVMETAQTDDGILLSSDVGKAFLDLGLAVDTYVDVNFNGTQTKVYLLNTAGRAAARIYLFVTYFFSGNTFQFSGTVIPFAVNSTNLSITESANSVAVGWRYIPNDNSSLDSAVENNAFDLSQSVHNGIIQADWSTISFNPNDPAVLNNAIWSYDPSKNNSTLTYSGAWQLFLDKDFAQSDMLISAGTAISNLFIKGREEINYDVMNVMLNVCEKRKDLFAIFDGVNEPNINKALQKMVGIGSVGDLARWGGIYDGRSLFFDSAYTKLVVEAVQTVPLANIITSNRAGNTWWLPPAGYDYGRMPAQWSRSQLYTRTYKYADDPNSDIARLYDANINPIRVNDQGQFVYGQKTMLKRTTALNRMNVIMLIAGIHKRFQNYLDTKVFQLNTSQLRANITADLQAQLNNIKSANPAGITAGLVICDDTNNTPIIIDTNQLIVDVVIQPTRSTEFITLRTTVQRTGADLNVSTSTIIGG